MEEKKVTKDQIIKGVEIGLGMLASCCVGAYIGYKVGLFKINNDFRNGQWKFNIENNARLKMEFFPDGSKRVHWWKFKEGDTKEIVDTLMDQFYPGD